MLLPAASFSLMTVASFSPGPEAGACAFEKSQDSVPPGRGTGLPNLSVQVIRILPAGFFCRLK